MNKLEAYFTTPMSLYFVVNQIFFQLTYMLFPRRFFITDMTVFFLYKPYVKISLWCTCLLDRKHLVERFLITCQKPTFCRQLLQTWWRRAFKVFSTYVSSVHISKEGKHWNVCCIRSGKHRKFQNYLISCLVAWHKDDYNKLISHKRLFIPSFPSHGNSSPHREQIELKSPESSIFSNKI